MRRHQHDGHHDYDEQTRETGQRTGEQYRSNQDYETRGGYGSDYDEPASGRRDRERETGGQRAGRGNWGSWNSDYNRNEDNQWRGERGDYGNRGYDYGGRSYDRENRGRSDWGSMGRSDWNEPYTGRGSRGYDEGYQGDQYGTRRSQYSDYDRYSNPESYERRGNYGNQSNYGSFGNYGNAGNYGNQRGYDMGGNYGNSSYRPFEDYGSTGRSYGNEAGRGMTGYSSERNRGMYGMDYESGATTQHKGKGPKGYQRSDERIKEDVSDRLTDEGSLDATEIQVEVKGSEVVLSGTVNNRRDKRRAEDLAESVSGVKNVENRIRVSETNRTGSQSNTENSTEKSEQKTGTSATSNTKTK